MTDKIFRNQILLCIVLVWAACQASQKEHLLYYKDSGAVLRRYYTVNDKIEGKMFEYHPDGTVKFERNFENGVENGPVSTYYPNGKVKEKQYIDHGKIQGSDTIWNADGRVQRVTNFRDGKVDGDLRTWNPDGSLLFEARYSMDSLLEMKKAPVAAPERDNKPR